MSKTTLSRRDVLGTAIIAGSLAAMPSLVRGAPAKPAKPTVANLELDDISRRIDSGMTLVPNWGAVITGGEIGQRVVDSAHFINLATGEVTPLQPMLGPRSLHATVAISNDELLVLGGRNGRRLLSSVEKLDLRTGVWTPMPGLPSPRAGFHVIPGNGGLWIIGGATPAGPAGATYYELASRTNPY